MAAGWFDSLYSSPRLRDLVSKSYGEVFTRYAADVWIAEGGVGQPPPEFVAGMVEDYTEHHISSSRAQLQEIVSGVPNDAEAGHAIAGRLKEWLAKRPDKVASNETVRAANAIAVERMRSSGVTRKVWRTSGGKTCPYCKGLNARTISVEESFFEAGGAYQPAGAKTPLTFRSSIGHPPVHQGCDCWIEAATEVQQGERLPSRPTGTPDRATVQWAKDVWGTRTGPFFSSLTKAQMEAASRYSGSDYRTLNRMLRKGSVGTLAARRRIEALQEAINRTAIDRDIVVSRGTTLSAFNRYHPRTFIGKEIMEPGFMSTSTKGQGSFLGFDHAVRLNITAPKGTRALYMEPVTAVKGENEILFGHGTRMRVDSVTERTVRGRTEYVVNVTIVGP